ncbi:MAG: hypothetical protein L0216_13825 [Planctomycetales bacterium]|nr:hypothetical protein [Planctomycetales bacterium]
MASHFDCIGLSAGDPAELSELLDLLARTGAARPARDGGRTIVWRDPSGAGLVLSVRPDGEVACATPTFASSTVARAIPRRFAKDPDCRFCDRLVADLLDEAGERLYPLATQLEDIAEARPRIPFGQPVRAALAGFAEEVRTFPDEARFEAAQDGGARLAAESFIPSGLFGPDGPPEGGESAHALVTGRVEEAETRTNEATRRPFCVVRVRTYGLSLDLVASCEDLPEPPQRGSILQGALWLVGRIVDGLRDAGEPGLLGRLVGR